MARSADLVLSNTLARSFVLGKPFAVLHKGLGFEKQLSGHDPPRLVLGH
jgi:hypothetical protein